MSAPIYPAQPMEHVAVIDLGSNTCRIVVLESLPGYAFRLKDQIREVVRLRHGMSDAGMSDDAMARGYATLRLFKQFCTTFGVSRILATATSAVREATNGAAFVDRISEELGLPIRVLSEEEEAYLGAVGALNETRLKDGFVLDVGGGSAQISQICDRAFKRGVSRPLGALALTDRFVTSDPVADREFKAVAAEIATQLDSVPWLQDVATPAVVGIGGTIRNLALMEAARRKLPINTLRGFVLTRKGVAEAIAELRDKKLSQRRRISGLNSDRADIILPGAMVVAAVLDRLGVAGLTVSVDGLREGVFAEYFWAHRNSPIIPDAQRFGVLNLARIYRYEKAHANHVRYLTRRLFTDLAPVHGYGDAAWRLLSAASLLHDIGTAIGYRGHHKHSQTLIEYNGLPGFSPRETALIGLMARYHRKGTPSIDDHEALLQAGDLRLLTQLTALLRLAEFLERGRGGSVDDLIVTVTDSTIEICLVADTYPAVELWEAERKAVPLMETAFDRTVRLTSLASPSRTSG